MGLLGQPSEPAFCCCLLVAVEGCWVQGGCWEVNFRGCLQRGGRAGTEDTVSWPWEAGARRGPTAEQGGTGAQLSAVPGLAARTEVRAQSARVAVREGWRFERAAGGAAVLRTSSSQPQESWSHDQTRPVLGDSTARAPPPSTHRNAEEVWVVGIVGSDRLRGAAAAGVAATAAAE